MHNDNNKNMKWMMYLMMICCVAPLLILVIGTRLGSNWWVIGGIAVFIALHFWMMRKGHGCGTDHSKAEEKNNDHH